MNPGWTVADEGWVRSHLSGAQQSLFFQMATADQAHAVRVARRLNFQQAPGHVLEAALLHDCGKPADYGLLARIMGVLVGGSLVDIPREPPARGLARQLQIYRWHDAYGLDRARAAGTSEAAMDLLEAYRALAHAPGSESKNGVPAWLEPLMASDDLG